MRTFMKVRILLLAAILLAFSCKKESGPVPQEQPGEDTEIVIDDDDLPDDTTFAAGSGTEADPWLIKNAFQFENMMNLYKDAEAPADKNSFKYWFKLVKDIDASSITWAPLNNSGSFYKAIDFDGGGHTVTGLTCTSGSYPSFAGVLYGSVRNVTFDGATISGTTKKGVVAGFMGTTGLPGFCEGVTVTGSTVSGSSYSGGFDSPHLRISLTTTNMKCRSVLSTATWRTARLPSSVIRLPIMSLQAGLSPAPTPEQVSPAARSRPPCPPLSRLSRTSAAS